MDLIAYTDGTYHRNSGWGAWAVIVVDRSGSKIGQYSGLVSPAASEGTWQVASELAAAAHAVNIAREMNATSLIIRHDLKMVGTLPYANEKSMRKRKDQSKRYRRFMIEAAKNIALTFEHVKAHSGVKYNEEADRLATKTIAGFIKSYGKT